MKRSMPLGGLPNVKELDTGLQCDDQLVWPLRQPDYRRRKRGALRSPAEGCEAQRFSSASELHLASVRKEKGPAARGGYDVVRNIGIALHSGSGSSSAQQHRRANRSICTRGNGGTAR